MSSTSTRVPEDRSQLSRSLGATSYFALSFGCIVGSGWVIMLGEWLKLAGPGGAVLAFSLGALIMLCIAACYAELAVRMPRAGGEFLYAVSTFGKLPGFVVGWFLTLYLVGFCAFEGIALAWLLETLFSFQGVALYQVQGEWVTSTSLIIGIAGAMTIGLLNLRKVQSSLLFQRMATYLFMGAAFLLTAIGLLFGKVANWQPLFPAGEESHWLWGVFWICATCAVFLNGFQSALHAIEERAPTLSSGAAVRAMLLGIPAAALFYSAITLAASASSAWPTLVDEPLPAVAAFASLPYGNVLAPLVLVAATISLLKTWNAITIMASRLILAQARFGILPHRFAAVHQPSGSPRLSVTLVVAIAILGIALGRGAIIPIINMATICVSISLVICLVALIRIRRGADDHPEFTTPGGMWTIGAGLCGATFMTLFALWEPLSRNDGFPLEWVLLIGWAVLGLVLYGLTQRSRRAPA